MTDESGGDSGTELLRLRQAVAEYHSLILVALLLVAGLGAWAGYTAYLDPGVETEERTVSTWSRTATFSHGAEVTRPNPIYSTGLRLTNRRAYFPRVAPILEGEYQFSYTATRGGSVDIITNVQLLVQSGEDGTVFWQSTQSLKNRETAGVGPDRAVVTRYQFNMSRVQARLDRVSDTLGDTPGETEVLVRAETRLTGDVNGRTIDRRFVDDLRLVPDGDTFLVSDPGQVRNSSRQTETIQRERDYSLLWRAGAPLLVVLGLGGAGGLVYGRRNGLLSVDPELLDREEYSEWVSHGTLPPSFDPEGDGVVALDSLGDLVDVAADIDERVLYDSEYGCYAVLDTRYDYVYRPTSTADTISEVSSGDDGTSEESGTTGESESPDQTRTETIWPVTLQDDRDSGGVDVAGSDDSPVSARADVADTVVSAAATDDGTGIENGEPDETDGAEGFGADSGESSAPGEDVGRPGFDVPADIDESDLADEIRRFADITGEPPTEDLVVAYGRYPAYEYQTAFGSWEATLEAGGCDPDDLPDWSARSYTNVDILDGLRAVADELGRAPTTTEAGKRVDFSPGLASLRFGSWETALETAGLNRSERPSARDGVSPDGADDDPTDTVTDDTSEDVPLPDDDGPA